MDTFWSSQDPEPSLDRPVIENTRKSLERCKHITLDHLHDLLHEDLMLDEDEHIHAGKDLFNYVIEEMDDAPRLFA